MYIWLLPTIFTVILIRITVKWWYNKFDDNVGASLVQKRFVRNPNASFMAHLVNSIGYTLKILFNYELYNLSSFEWFKKKAIDENRRELNGFELKDFGDEKEINLFEKIHLNHLAVYRADPLMSTANLAVRQGLLIEAMKERLRIVHQLKAHPEIRQINIKSPICIVSQMRTGTTLLYNLLALDPLACFVTFDTAVHPSLPWNSNSDEPDPRVKITKRLIREFKVLMPNFDKVHYFDTCAPEECILTLTNIGIDYVSLFGGKDLAILKYLFDDTDFEQVYEYHRLLLQFLSYKKQGFTAENNHCVFKCPLHTLSLSSLLKVYSDARVIVTHRDLKEVVPSLASLMEISSNSSYIDLFDIGRKALQISGLTADILVKETTLENNKRNFIHISYTDLVKDPHQVIKNIYSQCQLDYTEEFDKKITEYLQQNPQGKYGRNIYSLAKYGLSEVELQYRFDTYSKTFLTNKT